MDAIYALHNRVSVGKLKAPAPTMEQRELLYKAALRAADHGCLRPWRFLTVEGEGLDRLGELFLQAAQASSGEMDDAASARYLNMPKRAPLIIVAISENVDHPKVPVLEQEMAAAAAVQNLITAAYAENVGAYWRSGPMAQSAVVKEGLGMLPSETLVGFIYLGTPAVTPKSAPELPVQDFFKPWQG